MGFDLPVEKHSVLEKWIKTHKCKLKDPSKQGAIGGRFTYQFTPTSMGIITVVKCACGKDLDLDLTDYKSW